MKYLIFDLDDTIVPSTHGYNLAMKAISVNQELYLQARSEVKDRLPNGHVAARNRWLYFKRYLELQGSYSPGRLIEMMDQYEEELSRFLAMEWKRLKRDDLFQQLSSHAKIGLLTNETTRTQLLKLNAIDPDGKFFSTVCTSEEIGCEKPSDLMFNVIADRVGTIDPSNTFFIGDNVACDLVPAHKRGWKTFLTTEFTEESANRGDKFYTSLSKLDDLLEYV